jgi:hypothetical protein
MDADEMTVDDMIDALEDLGDDELLELRGAIDEEIVARNEPSDTDDDEDDEDEDY